LQKELEKAITFYKKRNYNDCLNVLLEIEKRNNLDENFANQISKYKLLSLLSLQRFAEAHALYDQQIENYSKNNKWEKVLESYLAKIRIYIWEWKREQAMMFVTQGEKILEQIDNLTPALIAKKGLFLFWKGHINFLQYHVQESIKLLQQAIAFSDKHSLPETKHHSMHRMALALGFLGKYQQAIEMLKKVLHYFKENGNDLATAGILHNLGVFYAEKGEYQKSRQLFEEKALLVGQTPHDIAAIGDSCWREGEPEKGLELMEQGIGKIKQQLQDEYQNAIYHFILGNLYSRKGEYDRAKQCYQKTIAISEKLNELSLIGFSKIGIAIFYYQSGELEKAKKYGLTALQIFENIDRKYGLGWAHFILAKIYYEKLEKEKAFSHANRCLDLRMAMANKQDMALILRDLLIFLLEDNKFDEIDDFFHQLEVLAKEKNNRIINHNYLLAKALILKSKSRPKSWIQAIDILEKIASEQIADYNTTLVALINLCDLLLNEFGISDDMEILADLETHSSRILDIAQKQNSYSLRVEAYHIRIITLWLQAQHAKVDINIQNAKRLLQEAEELANSYGLLRLSKKIGSQNDKMLEKLETWDEFIRKYYDFIKTS
jgi:tetratricopeptide (TPR) repeat protein